MKNLTKRQKRLLEIAIVNLGNLSDVVGIENHTRLMNYDGEQGELGVLADDLAIEFNLN